ncbi:MAG TPA: MFS transporter [Edaphobacter sp.]|nr:MFS transporter [Edaphobacter sp.]
MADRVKVAPSAGLLHFGFILTGLGTAILGPILPLLSHQWHLQDAQSGTLLLAQFCGSFLGGLSVSRHLRRSLLVGLIAATIGFGAFALAPELWSACVGLFIGGFGLGQTITATDILAGRRYTSHRGSALALLNFSWSLGAMLAPLLAAWLLPHITLRRALECFAGLFAVATIAMITELWNAPEEIGIQDVPVSGQRMGSSVFLYFAVMLFLYGGIETSLNGWLTTYALRYGDKNLAISEYTTVLFWMSLTIGRALSSAVMLRIGEKTVQRFGLILAALFTVGLATSHSAFSIAAYTVLLGLSLAPFFPSTFALVIAEKPVARQAGTILAVSGLGAAALTSLMGVISTRAGSLQLALGLPLTAVIILLGMSLLWNRKPVRQS